LCERPQVKQKHDNYDVENYHFRETFQLLMAERDRKILKISGAATKIAQFATILALEAQVSRLHCGARSALAAKIAMTAPTIPPKSLIIIIEISCDLLNFS
jgi:hypothetical protein